MAIHYETTADVTGHVRRQANALVRDVNPGRDYSSDWFAAKAAEVTKAIIRQLCLDRVGQGRQDLARKIRITWERSQR